MPYKIKNSFKRHFQTNFILYFILMIFFVLGIILGSILIKELNIEQKSGIIKFLNSFFKSMGEKKLNNIGILKNSLLDNLKTVFMLWITGFIILGIPIIPIVVAIRGIAIGFTVGFLVNEFGVKGFLFSILGILPQNLLFIPSILVIAAIGMSYSLGSVKNKRIKYTKNGFHGNIRNYSILILILCVVMLGGCLIEAFISPIFLNMVVSYF